MKDLIFPFRHAKDLGYILHPLGAGGAIGMAVVVIVLSLAWPR